MVPLTVLVKFRNTQITGSNSSGNKQFVYQITRRERKKNRFPRSSFVRNMNVTSLFLETCSKRLKFQKKKRNTNNRRKSVNRAVIITEGEKIY